MLKIKIISVGKIKEKAMNEIISEFEKRLTRYCNFESVVISDIPVKDNPSEADIEEVLKKEAQLIKARLNPKAYKAALCIEGKKLSSAELSGLISKIPLTNSEADFIIGSSHGLHSSIKQCSDFLLSMSDMTFPHNIARLMLTEQIYRSFKIAANESYHK